MDKLEVVTVSCRLTEDGSVYVTSNTQWNERRLTAHLQKDSIEEWTVQTLIKCLRDDHLDRDGIALLGTYLYTGFFEEALKETLARHRYESGKFLNLELKFENPASKIAAWPYEYLYCPTPREESPGYFILQEPRIALTRVPNVPPIRAIRVVNSVLRVLCVACSPSDEEPIGFTDVIRQIGDLQIAEVPDSRGVKRPQFKLLDPLVTNYITEEALQSQKEQQGEPLPPPQATWSNFVKTLGKLKEKNSSPHVIHFIGHGKCDEDGTGKVAFVGLDHKAEWVDGQKLAEVIRDSDAKLVFLQACETAKSTDVYSPYKTQSNVARALAGKSIPAVIAMQSKVEVLAANQFAVDLYKSLVAMMPVYQAMRAGGNVISSSNLLGIPILYLLRYNNEEGILFPEELPQHQSSGRGISPGSARTSISVKCPWCWESSSSTKCSFDGCWAVLRCPNLNCSEAVNPDERLRDKQGYECKKCQTMFDKRGQVVGEETVAATRIKNSTASGFDKPLPQPDRAAPIENVNDPVSKRS